MDRKTNKPANTNPTKSSRDASSIQGAIAAALFFAALISLGYLFNKGSLAPDGTFLTGLAISIAAGFIAAVVPGIPLCAYFEKKDGALLRGIRNYFRGDWLYLLMAGLLGLMAIAIAYWAGDVTLNSSLGTTEKVVGIVVNVMTGVTFVPIVTSHIPVNR
jgi:Zn-dependent protease with chaperone function